MEGKMSTILDRIKEANITKEEAMVLIEELKTAIENKDDTYITNVCQRINQGSNNPCSDLLNMDEVCSNVTLEYKLRDSDENQPEQYITLLSGVFGKCTKAYIYLEEDFAGFLDKDIDYLSSKGIKDVELIITATGEKIYTGKLDGEIHHDINKEKREGWYILLGILLFIGMGLLLKRHLR